MPSISTKLVGWDPAVPGRRVCVGTRAAYRDVTLAQLQANDQPVIAAAIRRGGNEERRNHYRSAEEATEAWMRFVAEEDADPICTTPEPTPEPSPTDHVAPGQAKKETPAPAPTPSPVCTQPPPNKRAIATIGTDAAHPTDSVGGENRAYADLAGVFELRAPPEPALEALQVHAHDHVGTLARDLGSVGAIQVAPAELHQGIRTPLGGAQGVS